MSNLVSAIITTHNRLDLLKRAISSVLVQSYPEIELIVVDDASNDGTQEYCERQSFKYIRISKENSRGGNHARNLGVEAAQGEYVAFLDDDDFWKCDKIEKQVKLISDSGCEVVHCYRDLEYIGKYGGEFFRYCPLNSLYQGDLSKRILWQISILTSAAMIKRQAIIDAGMFDENIKFWQEYELSIRLSQRAPFLMVPESLMVYRVDPTDQNKLTNKYSGWLQAVKYIYEKHKQLYSSLNIFEKLRVRILFWRDSSSRAKKAGLNLKAIKHSILYRLLNIPFRIIDKLTIMSR